MEIRKFRYDDTIIDLDTSFISEINLPDLEKRIIGHVLLTKHGIWSYKRTTSVKLYWLNRKTHIHKLVEIEWLKYLNRGLDYPNLSFSDYLLSGESWTKFRPETVVREIEIWFEMRNKITQ